MEKAHIVVANDDNVYLELMQELLQQEGYKVTVLHAGRESYKEIKAALPSLLILDMVLERPDAGWHVLGKLKLDPETTQIPVIVCSADVRLLREKEEHLRDMGCLVVEKPFDIDIMFAAVQKALAYGTQDDAKQLC